MALRDALSPEFDHEMAPTRRLLERVPGAEGFASREAIAATDDAAMMRPWTFLNDGHVVVTMPKAAVLRSSFMNHLIHHRGQLSAYLRLPDGGRRVSARFGTIARLALLRVALGLGVAALAGCDALGRGVERMTAAARPADTTSIDSTAGADSVRRSAVGGTSAKQPRKRSGPPKARRPGASTPVAAAAAASPESTPPSVAPPRRDPALEAMGSDLRRLVLAQRQHFANQGEFSSRLSQLAIRYVPHAGVTVQILGADATGWSARAMHESRPGWQCIVRGSATRTRPTPICDTTRAGGR